MNPYNLLVVDDEQIICELNKALLMCLGYKEVFLAYRGEEAIEIVKKEAIDAILMDITMPGIGGIEAALRIQQIKPNLPIIFITGYDSIKIDELPHSLVLRKPVSIDMLEEGLNTLLGNS